MAGLTLAGSASLFAQSHADTASRTSQSLDRVQAATNVAPATEGGIQQNESDLGDQQPVGAAQGGFGLYAIGSTGLYYTSNPFLSSGSNQQGDMYFVAQGGAGIHPNIVGGLYFDASFSEDVYLYSKFTSLDFNRLSASAGFDYVFESLGQLTASLHYTYERYLDCQNFDEFYVNNAITASVNKQFVLSDTQAIMLGADASISVGAQPDDALRDSYDLWISHRWRIIQPLELSTYYIVSLYYYPNAGNRVDVTQNVGTALTYSFTDWAKITASASFGSNNSTQSFFDYTMVNLGGSVGLEFHF